jgi:nickel superoxide dismutase
MNRTQIGGLFVIFAVVLACWPCSPLAHCEIPCGIYTDEMRIHMIEEHIQTIEKSMNQIVELSAANPVNYNQIVRWVTNKDEHADKIQDIVTQYFMTQRVKPVDASDKPAQTPYMKKLGLLHQILFQAMRAKQTTDLKHVEALREATAAFSDAYFGKTEKEHLREHHE